MIGKEGVMRAFRASMVGAILALAPTLASAQAELCANPSGFCNSLMTVECFETLGAGAAPLPAKTQTDCARRREIYRECLVNAAENCGPSSPARDAAGGCTSEREMALFETVKDSGSRAELEQFLAVCPQSPLGGVIKQRISALPGEAAGPTVLSETRDRPAPINPGFDCDAAETPQEKIICADGYASRAEKKMKDAWSAMRAATKSRKPLVWKAALVSQRIWLRARDRICRASEADVNDPTRFTAVADCIAALAEARAVELANYR